MGYNFCPPPKKPGHTQGMKQVHLRMPDSLHVTQWVSAALTESQFPNRILIFHYFTLVLHLHCIIFDIETQYKTLTPLLQPKYMKRVKCSFNENGKILINKFIYRTAEILHPALQSSEACSMSLFIVL